MKCPTCERPDLTVIDSRPLFEDATVRRRRQCQACNHRFSTIEVPLAEDSTAPFSRPGARIDLSTRKAAYECVELVSHLSEADARFVLALAQRLSPVAQDNEQVAS